MLPKERIEECDDYKTFLASKRIVSEKTGLKVSDSEINPILWQFERDAVRWALLCGRALLAEDCGLGKTFQQLEWSRLILKYTGGASLIVAPLCVNEQTISEAAKLGIEVNNVRHQSDLQQGINITNYEMIHHFIGAKLSAIALDESSILKSIDGATKKLLLEEFTGIPYRLCCTATPCPNDIAEIANHAEFLGVMKRNEMLASFFVHDQDGWRMRGHAAKPFYRWMASWCLAMKSPADLGYDAKDFCLPPLRIHDCVVSTDWRRPGELFAGGLHGITDRASVRKGSVKDRVGVAAELALKADGQVIVWCGINDETASVHRAIPDSENLQGSDSQERKKEVILRFLRGDLRVLITKGRIAGFGLNFQCAHTMIFMGMGDSYEMYYQCIRRQWRFGQKHPVDVYIVVTDHEEEIVENVRRKEVEAQKLSNEIISAAREYEMEELGKIRHEEKIDTAEFSGEGWKIYQGDCVEKSAELPDNSIDLSIFSPPFLALYTYSATERDMGNCRNDTAFFDHFGFEIDELLRITKPGRLCCVHCSQVPTTLVNHGVIGMKDFRGLTINAFESHGWTYHGEVCIDKDPQAQAIRTHSKGLLFVQLKKDASWLRPAMADYILVFRKPGDNSVPIHPDIDNEEWIEWARPIWYGIKESDTLNRAEARSEEDDRHVCPLQLGTIERCVRLWSNSGETIFSPFAGIGSEGYVAIQHGRKFIGIELKPLYARTAERNLRRAEKELSGQNDLFAKTAR